MPTYEFLNKETGDIKEYIMSYKDLDKFKENNPHLLQQITAPNFVGGTGDRVKPDSGFQEVMSKIASNNIDTPLGERYHRKSAKEVKTRDTIQKHIDIQSRKK
jgi:hypothetical protein|tara:strand:+ start:2109 stop:2417 length:309 start_codon:yes stop_codon:yes gene_type:complete